MEERFSRLCRACILGSSLAAMCSAQDEKIEVETKNASRLIRLLELPSRRAEAVDEILKIGKKSAPALAKALRDPRPEIVGRLVMIIAMMGEDAKSTVPVMRAISNGDDPRLAYAARWGLARFEPMGITLLSDRTKSRILEVDRNGKEVWSLGDLAGVNDARRLPSGHYLVALYRGGEVREIDRKGRVIWRHKTEHSPVSAMRLPNGNTLICAPFRDETVTEVSPEGKVVWSFAPGEAWAASRLTDGRTLVPWVPKKVIRIVDAKGQLEGTIPGKFGTVGIDVTTRGTILISLHGRKAIWEVDFKGKMLHELKLPGRPHTAQRLPDGGMVVAAEDFAALYDSKGRQVWALKGSCYGSAVHY
jgi:PQQ-like domain